MQLALFIPSWECWGRPEFIGNETESPCLFQAEPFRHGQGCLDVLKPDRDRSCCFNLAETSQVVVLVAVVPKRQKAVHTRPACSDLVTRHIR